MPAPGADRGGIEMRDNFGGCCCAFLAGLVAVMGLVLVVALAGVMR